MVFKPLLSAWWPVLAGPALRQEGFPSSLSPACFARDRGVLSQQTQGSTLERSLRGQVVHQEEAV